MRTRKVKLYTTEGGMQMLQGDHFDATISVSLSSDSRHIFQFDAELVIPPKKHPLTVEQIVHLVDQYRKGYSGKAIEFETFLKRELGEE